MMISTMINLIKSFFAKPEPEKATQQQPQKTFYEEVVEISSNKIKEHRAEQLLCSEQNIVRMLEKTKYNVMSRAKFGGTAYTERLDDNILTDARMVNDWCKKEHGVEYLEDTLRTYLGKEFSVTIEHTRFMSTEIVELYISWYEEDED